MAEDNSTLADHVNTYTAEFYQEETAKPVSPYPNFLILHRWGYRITFNILGLIILVCVLLLWRLCWDRVLFHWFIGLFILIIVIPSILIFGSLLYYDPSPFWKRLNEGNTLLMGILFIGVVIIFISNACACTNIRTVDTR